MTRVRFLVLTAFLFCLAALVAGSPAQAAQPGQATPPFGGVVTDNANLRSSPATTYDRVGGVSAGQVVQVRGCNDACDWYQLDDGSWIAAFLVQPQASAAGATVTPAALPATTPAPPSTSTSRSIPAEGLVPARVTSATEGDSMHVSVDGEDALVRYLGIDSPDRGSESTNAKLANQKLVEGQVVYLEKDVTAVDTYGRLLRYVWLADGRLLNQELVRLGCAAVIGQAPGLKYQDRLLRAQGAAQEAQRTCSLQDVATPTESIAGLPALPPTPAPTAVLRSAPGSGRGSANTTANLRSGPGTEYDVSGQLAPGDTVQLAGCNDACDWYKLNSGQWVFAELITMAAVPTPAPVAAATAAPTAVPTAARVVNVSASAPASGQEYGVVTADWLNVRAAPGTNGEIVGVLPLGSCVEVVALQPQWAQVKLPAAQTGWCIRDYLSLTSACPTPAPVAQSVVNAVAFEPPVAAGCAATSVKANAVVVGSTFAHECFGEGDGGLREVSAGTPVELLGVGAFQPPADQAAKMGTGPFFKARIWDGQVAWLPASAVNADPATYPGVSAVCEACDKLEWAQVPRIRDAPTPVPVIASRASSYTPSYGGSTGGSSSSCCKVCTTGKACGNSCISRSYTCHKGPGCACNG